MSDASEQTRADQPLVSVIVPTCNRREVLAKCLAALASQTHPSYEVIVVDDGSTDDTPGYLEKFVTEHPELAIRYLRNEVNIGANPSRNRGIRAARGDIVALSDDDCIARPDWLERLSAGFTSDRVAAVVGLVESPVPANIYELTLKGTQRVSGSGHANRLVGGNMAVRREALLKYSLDEDRATQALKSDGTPDVTVSGRGDEEGLYLMLRAAGYEQHVVPDAVVLHQHRYSRRSFFRQALRGGRSAARLVYKFYLPPRLDLLPFMLAYVTLPLILLNRWLLVVPVFFFAGALAAITYNDLFRKGKTIAETIRSFPMLLVYYHLRLFGYVTETMMLRLGKHRLERRHLRTKN
jgi:glycosyltransferase involved in cell wall biosynthesis